MEINPGLIFVIAIFGFRIFRALNNSRTKAQAKNNGMGDLSRAGGARASHNGSNSSAGSAQPENFRNPGMGSSPIANGNDKPRMARSRKAPKRDKEDPFRGMDSGNNGPGLTMDDIVS